MNDTDDKITIIVNTAKKIANVLKDPTQGREMSPEERNKRRGEAFDDINTCIDVFATLASASDGYFDILALAGKYKQ